MNTLRKIFLGLFILSTLGVLILFIVPSPTFQPPASATQASDVAPTPPTGDPGAVEPSSENSKDINYAAMIGSVVTSVTSLIGFITTTAITWRKEKRESTLADMERKKLETELEKSRLELEEMKKGKKKKK